MIPKIVIIDSGINSQIVECNTIDVLHIGNEDKNGHGTACASVIRKICPTSELISIPILDENNCGNSEGLEKALDECKKIDCDIINLSLAITDRCKNEKKIRTICSDLARDGKIIVSSVQNGRNESLPASYKSVIGVKGKLFQNVNRYWYNPKKNIQLITDMTPCFTEAISSHYFIFSGNSKANAVASGIIARFLSCKELCGKKKLSFYLRDNAEKNCWRLDDEKYSIDELKEKKLHSVNNEIIHELHNIFRYRFEIEIEFTNDDNLLNIGKITYISIKNIIHDMNCIFNSKLALLDMFPKDFLSINNMYSALRRKRCIKH